MLRHKAILEYYDVLWPCAHRLVLSKKNRMNAWLSNNLKNMMIIFVRLIEKAQEFVYFKQITY